MTVVAVATMATVATAGTPSPAGAGQLSGFGTSGRVVETGVNRLDVSVRPDGDLVAVGVGGAGHGSFTVVERKPDGTPDTGFGDAATPGRKVLTVTLPAYSDDVFGPAGAGLDAAGNLTVAFSSDIGGMLARVRPDGSLDPAYGGGDGVLDDQSCGNALDATIMPSGVAYTLSHPMGFQFGPDGCPGMTVRRYSAQGTKDATWGNQGRSGYTVTGAHFDERLFGSALAVDHTGRVVVAGARSLGEPRVAIARMTALGQTDAAFGTAGLVELDPDTGAFAVFPTFSGGAVGSFTAGHHSKMATDVAVDAAGRVVAVGTTCPTATANSCTSPTSIWALRLGTDGQPDPTFGTGGYARIDPTAGDDYALTVTSLPSGRVVVGGFHGTGPVREFVSVLTADGRPDQAFAPAGTVLADFGVAATESQQPSDIAVASEDRFAVAANVHDPALARFTASISAYDAGDAAFHPISPLRVMDTREALGGITLAPGETRTLPIAGTGTIPTNATAVALNLTIDKPSTPGYLTAWPTGTNRPTASSINFTPGQTIANGITVGLGTNGQLDLYNPSGTTDVIIDITGWYQPSSVFGPISPLRVM
ncbi:MAG: hypothetical protein OEY23_03610, partial [Acidimicrobiia bacterium]|nr:hypothetical protein [Acidimicrobiia bacterium]